MTKILRLPDVMQITALSRSSIYAFVSKGTFPKPISLGARAVGWLDADVSGWIESRIVNGKPSQNEQMSIDGGINEKN